MQTTRADPEDDPYEVYAPADEGAKTVTEVQATTEDGTTYRFYDRREDLELSTNVHPVMVFDSKEVIYNE